MHKYELLLTLW